MWMLQDRWKFYIMGRLCIMLRHDQRFHLSGLFFFPLYTSFFHGMGSRGFSLYFWDLLFLCLGWSLHGEGMNQVLACYQSSEDGMVMG